MGCVRVASGEKCPLHGNRIIEGSAFTHAPIVDIAARVARRNGVDDIGLLGRDPDHPEMWTDGHTDVFQDTMVLIDVLVVDHHSWII